MLSLMKFLKLLLLSVGFCLIVASRSFALDLNEKSQKAYDTLKKTTSFSMGGVGYAAQTSEGEKALRVLKEDPKAGEAFAALIEDKDSKKAGQLYALLGLKWRDQEKFESLVPPFLEDKTQVEEQSGCIVFRMSVYFIAQEIRDDKWKEPK